MNREGKRPLQVADNSWWLATLDPDLRIFDVIMRTESGTTYNSYLVRGSKKTAIIDTVKEPFKDLFWKNLCSLVDPAEVDYVVVNHNESDHSGALPLILDKLPNAKLIVSPAGKSFLQNILNRKIDPILASDDMEIDLGGKTLKFAITPFLHWPDTMCTYVPEDKLLYSCDIFASHYCDERMFNDLTNDFARPFHYYFNIIMRPYKEYVLKALKKLDRFDIDVICPSHGPILREDAGSYMERYREWSQPDAKKKGKLMLVAYTTAYGNTANLAKAFGRGVQESGVRVAMMDIGNLSEMELSSVVDVAERADGIAIGTPTINGDAPEPIWKFLASTATIKRKGKFGFTFGSYGWSGEAPVAIARHMKSLRMRVPHEPFRIKFRPTEEDFAQIKELGRNLAADL
ncbi:MAG: FprA family A-type flavoprotein [Epsilonproteobacteria bacterium]|nr:FprA family A-type flavoprotein [Campylobacterota bacterium]